jgi:glycosyltransferase involved in cell wall biosynthesis
MEIIVVDDGSTDGTWDWLQKQEDIIAIQQSNQGKCAAVNKAFAVAKGKYVRFLDSDDQVLSGANDIQFALAEEGNADLVVSGYRSVDENNQLLHEQSWTICDDFIAQQLGECDSSHYSAYLFKKTFVDNIPHREEFAYRDDRLFVLEAALKHPKVAMHDGFALQHTQHRQERLQVTSGRKHAIQNTQHVNLYRLILDQLKEQNELTPRRIKAAEKILWPLCHWIARYDVSEAAGVLTWLKMLNPEFKIPEHGTLGILYHSLGFKVTERLLSLRRKLIHG